MKAYVDRCAQKYGIRPHMRYDAEVESLVYDEEHHVWVTRTTSGDTQQRKIESNCAQCHTTKAWVPATFEHDDYFHLDRDHNTQCATCHTNNNHTDYTCYGCHEYSRRGTGGREGHLEEGIRDFENCTECHRSADEDEAKHALRKRRVERN